MSESQWEALLEELGFSRVGRHGSKSWRADGKTWQSGKKTSKAEKISDDQVGSLGGSASPWRCSEWTLTERREGLTVQTLDLSLDRPAFMRSLASATKRHFGQRTTGHFKWGEGGQVWCLFECVRPGARDEVKGYATGSETGDSPLGLVGFSFRLVGAGRGMINVHFADHFAIGYAPSELLTAPKDFVRDSLGLTGLPAEGVAPLFEDSFNACDPWLSMMVRASGMSQKRLDAEIAPLRAVLRRAFHEGHLGVSVSSGSVSVSYPADEGFSDRYESMQGIPVEVLETREWGESIASIDRPLVLGKFDRAFSALAGLRKDAAHDLIGARRAALLGLLGRREGLRQVAEFGLRAEPENKLFLSAALAAALHEGRREAALDLLSKLGERLDREIEGCDAIPGFDVVMPEMLGDLWRQEDPGQAFNCYHRILAKRGEVTRILRKMIALAQASGDFGTETDLIQRLVRTEKRKSELAKLHFRLAAVAAAQGYGAKQVLHEALRAFELNRTLYQAALLAAESFVGEGRSREAVDLLDGLLRDGRTNVPTKARAVIEHTIGKIWQNHLNRLDLAQRRFEQAMRLDPTNLQLEAELEVVFRRPGGERELAAFLERQFEVAETNGDASRMKVLFEELVSLYRGPLNDSTKAIAIFTRMAGSMSLDPKEIDRFLDWNGLEADWQELYMRLSSTALAESDPSFRAQYHVRLAKIADLHLKDRETAVKHWLEALQDGFLDAHGFQFLEEVFNTQRNYRALAELYERRLADAPASERTVLLRTLMGMPEGVSDEHKDRLALRALGGNDSSESQRILQLRLQHYARMDDCRSLGRFAEALLNESEVSSDVREGALLAIVEALQDCHGVEKFPVVDRVLRQAIGLASDRTELLKLGVTILRAAGDPQMLSPYIESLLTEGMIPDLDAELIRQALATNDVLLADYYGLLCEAAPSPEEGVEQLRRALALLMSKGGHDAKVEQILGRICTLVRCEPSDLNHLKSVVGRSANWPLLARALERQSEFESDPDRKNELLKELSNVYHRKIGDGERARRVIKKAESSSAKPHRLQVESATIALSGGDVAKGKAELRVTLLEAFAADDIDCVEQVIRLLIENGESPDSVQKLVSPLLEQMHLRNENSHVLRIGSALIEVGSASIEVFQHVFAVQITLGDLAGAKKTWCRALKVLASATRTKAFLEETGRLAKEAKKPRLIAECLRQVFVDSLINKLHRRTRKEILLAYGAILFDQDSKRKKALRIYQEAYVADPEDKRSWMPLYFLIQEFGGHEQRIKSLLGLIPKLEADSSPLQKLPLTIESLQAELKQLQRGENPKPIYIPRALTMEDREILFFKPRKIGLATDDEAEEFKLVERDKREEALGRESLADKPDSAKVPGDREADGMFAPVEGINVRKRRMPLPVGAVVPVVEITPVVPAPDDQAPSHSQSADIEADQGATQEDVPAEAALMPLQVAAGGEYAREAIGHALELVPPPPELNFDLQLPPAPPSEGFSLEPSPPTAEPMHVESREASVVPVTPESPLPLERSLDGAFGGGELSLIAGLPAFPEPAPAESTHMFDLGLSSPFEQSPPTLTVVPAQLPLENPVEDSKPLDLAVPTVERFKIGSLPVEESPVGDQPLPPPPPPEMIVAVADPVAENELPQAPQVDLDLASSERTIQFRSGESDGDLPVEQSVDWRAAIKGPDYPSHLLRRVLAQAFASELEKHLAVQAIALTTGSCDQLHDWHWRVWRSASEFGYPLSGKDRYPNGTSPKILGGPLHRLVAALLPMLVRIYPDRFALDQVAAKLQISMAQLERVRVPLRWNAGSLGQAGFVHYADRLKAHRYHVFHLQGLGKKLFYDGRTRALYIDEDYYKTKPPSILFHRILGILWSVKLHYFVPLELDPIRDVLPVINDLRSTFEATGVARLKGVLGLSKTRVSRVMDSIDQNQVRALVEKLGTPQYDSFIKLWEVLQEHVYRLLATETLDVVGLFEAITDRDLLAPGALRPGEIFQIAPCAQSLFEFVMQIKV